MGLGARLARLDLLRAREQALIQRLVELRSAFGARNRPGIEQLLLEDLSRVRDALAQRDDIAPVLH